MEKLLEIVLYIVNILIISLSQAYALHLFSKIICKNNFSYKKLLITFICFIPFSIILVWMFYRPELKIIKSFLGILSLVIASFIIYRTNILKTIIIDSICTVLPFIFDMLTVVVLSIFITSSDNINDFLQVKTNYYLTNIAINSIYIPLLRIIDYIINKKFNYTSENDKPIVNYKTILYQGMVILVSLVPTMFLMSSKNYNYPIEFIFINTFQLIVVSIFSFLYIKKRILFKDTELELENTKLHNKALATINENIRGFKHDMGNMVQSINGFLTVGNIEGVKNYCKNLLHGFNDINLLSILSPKIINDPAIYGIVVSKMLYARDNNLTLSLDIGLDVSKINFPSFELSRIIGILLDNAIEASLASDDKKLKLEMYHDENRKQDVIIIGNSVKDPTKVDIIKMFEKDYSTKENPSGFGLYEVLKFLKKNNKGDIVPNINYDTNFFTQTLIFDR